MDKLSLMRPFEYGPTPTGMAIKLLQTIALGGRQVIGVIEVNMVGFRTQIIGGHGRMKCAATGQVGSIVFSKIPVMRRKTVDRRGGYTRDRRPVSERLVLELAG